MRCFSRDRSGARGLQPLTPPQIETPLKGPTRISPSSAPNELPSWYKYQLLHHSHTARHVKGTDKRAEDRISTPGITQTVRSNSDLPVRAWGAASTHTVVIEARLWHEAVHRLKRRAVKRKGEAASVAAEAATFAEAAEDMRGGGFPGSWLGFLARVCGRKRQPGQDLRQTLQCLPIFHLGILGAQHVAPRVESSFSSPSLGSGNMNLPRTRSETSQRGVEIGPASVGCAQPHSGESNLDASQGSVLSLHQRLVTARPLTDARTDCEKVSAGSACPGHILDTTLLTVEDDDDADQRRNEMDNPGDTRHAYDRCLAVQPRNDADGHPICSLSRL